ncbi:uncharacterized protein LOC111019601 [Momordica charantia]|uniref:Uncharacterized protein LOC111019601 n=1 Tax=Momordica charantia TaxID=3673 RepID=A0A6J1DBW0_MOMCH|nr:uncharacterized protein LOC111019601 [Momordica charantia]
MVDGTHLKGKFKGVLLIGVAMDGNNQIYLLAFAIVDNESDVSWKWFMKNLKDMIGDQQELVFIYDRHVNITNATSEIFPDAFHAICTYHLGNNIKSRFKNAPFYKLYQDAAYAYRKSQFTYYWNQILSIGSGSLAKYLQEIGIERWARCYQVGRRYENMTTNSAASVNAFLQEARELPITKIVEFICELLQRWFHERRTQWSTQNTSHSDYAEERLAVQFEKSRRYTVKPIDWCMFHVKDGGLDGTVDLNARTYTCMEFQYMGIPCSHAIAAARHKNINYHTLIDPCYSVDSLIGAYAEPILLVGHMSEWKRPPDYHPIPVQPPRLVKRAGRRRTQRITSTGERRVVNKCSRCGTSSHNRQTCTNPITQARTSGCIYRGTV